MGYETIPSYTLKNHLLNQVANGPQLNNLICLFVKQHIYVQRCKNKKLSAQEIELRYGTRNVEKYILL